MIVQRCYKWGALCICFPLVASASANGYFAAASLLSARGYTVLPDPQRVELKGADFEFGDGWRLELGSGVQTDDVAVETLKNELSSRYSLILEAIGGSHAQSKVISLAIQAAFVRIGAATDKNKASLEEQAYRLELSSEGIRIIANAPVGLFYGVNTLVQLVIPAQGKLWLPTGTITDWPDLGQRDIFWDDSHHLEHPDVLKAALRQAAFYKINGFTIKLDGHYQYRSAPAVVEPYALSPAELQELTDYGLRYHVQLIPYLDSPGHVSFILKHPEYASLREYPDSNYEMCSTNPASYKLLKAMFQDLLDANRGVNYFVLSNDEPYYVGLADNTQCHEAERTKELGSPGKVMAEFLAQTSAYLHDRGRTVIFRAGSPMQPDDVPFLPSYLVNRAANYEADQNFERALQAHGIRGMIRTAPEGSEPLFPSYYLLPTSQLFNPIPITSELNEMYQQVAFTQARTDTDLTGVLTMPWGDEGLHPETFWLGFTTGSSWGWRPGCPGPDGAASNFYRLFYGQGTAQMSRLYQLMSTQAEFWNSSWDPEPSTARKLVFGNSFGVYQVRRPARDSTLPLPPVPEGEYLRLAFDWTLENARRVQMAKDNMPASDELLDLLSTNLRSVQFQRYNLEVFLSIAGLYRQNLQMLEEMADMDRALKAAQAAAEQAQFDRALAGLDRALDIAKQIRRQRNETLNTAVDTWYQSWYPRVEEANGRHYLDAVDDVKDHLPARTADMSYLVYREMRLPLGSWFDRVEQARNQYAQAHRLPARTDKLNWNDLRAVIEGTPEGK